MTKKELDYERMLKQMNDLQEKLAKSKESLDKERDELVVTALHETAITREQGFKIARLIGDPECLEMILKIEPRVEEKVVKKRGRRKNSESIITESEEKEYEE